MQVGLVIAVGQLCGPVEGGSKQVGAMLHTEGWKMPCWPQVPRRLVSIHRVYTEESTGLTSLGETEPHSRGWRCPGPALNRG